MTDRHRPVHPALVHVPVGGYLLACVFDVIALFGRQSWGPGLSRSATYALTAGAVASLAAVATGFLDWKLTPRGNVRSMATIHGVTMASVQVLVWISLLLRWTVRESGGAVLVLSLAIGALTIAGAALGGMLVYDHGLGVHAREVPDEPEPTRI